MERLIRFQILEFLNFLLTVAEVVYTTTANSQSLLHIKAC